MEFLMDPSVQTGLLTLIVSEIVLGIDNLVFVTVLADKLPLKQRDKARLLRLSLVLTMRLGLLSLISQMIMPTKPPFTAMDLSFSGRDLIMLFGGALLLSKATIELCGQLENRDHDPGHGKGYTSFQVVVTQIVILDAVLLSNAVTTAIGMVNHLPMMMAAVVIVTVIMLLASKPLTRFVNQYPMVMMFCLSFLLMIGLSPVTEGFGFYIPKGYPCVVIDFSIIIEMFNQIVRCNFIRRQSTLPLRARTADAILRLIGGKRQANVQHDTDSPMSMPILEDALAEEERCMINGVLTLASCSLRGIMTPRGEISQVDTSLRVDETREQPFSSPHSLFSVCRGELDEIIGVVRTRELLVALEGGADVAAIASVSPTIIVPEVLDPINPLGMLRYARGSFVIVTNEFGMVQGPVTSLDVSETIAGEFPNADETPEITIDDDGRPVKGGTDLYALQQALDVEHLTDNDDIAAVAGLVILTGGHIPRADDVIDVGPLHIAITEANDYHADLVRIAKEQPAHDEDE